ncbi:MAG: protease inhibitor I42 family protein [Legionella sp.]
MRFVISLCLVVYAWAATASTDMILTVDPDVKEFVVSLIANPTTGYQWSLKKYDKNLLRLKSSDYQKVSNGLVGIGGKMNFRFEFSRVIPTPPSTLMIFSYSRPWEPNDAINHHMLIKFKNKDNSQ